MSAKQLVTLRRLLNAYLEKMMKENELETIPHITRVLKWVDEDIE